MADLPKVEAVAEDTAGGLLSLMLSLLSFVALCDFTGVSFSLLLVLAFQVYSTSKRVRHLHVCVLMNFGGTSQ